MTAFVQDRCNWSFAGLGSPPAGDIGQKALQFARSTVDELKAGLAARTSWVFNDLHALAEENGVKMFQSRTFLLAQRFLLALPVTVPAPELSFDKDGEVSFDWHSADGRMLVVTLREDGRMSYASRISADDRGHGTKRFDDVLPKSIVEMVQQVTRD